MGRAHRVLTIAGETRTIAEWARISGTARLTIHQRLFKHWSDHDAVFCPDMRGKGPRKRQSKHETVLREAVTLAPNPHRPNPLRPTVGGYRAWPLEALDVLRRSA